MHFFFFRFLEFLRLVCNSLIISVMKSHFLDNIDGSLNMIRSLYTHYPANTMWMLYVSETNESRGFTTTNLRPWKITPYTCVV